MACAPKMDFPPSVKMRAGAKTKEKEMKIQKGKSGDAWATANDLHEMKGTTRSWLRELWKAGKVRRRTITAHGQNGELKTKYLYNVDDVESELSKTERKGVQA